MPRALQLHRKVDQSCKSKKVGRSSSTPTDANEFEGTKWVLAVQHLLKLGRTDKPKPDQVEMQAALRRARQGITVLCIDRVCRDCNIHDRMSFASYFGAALIVVAIVLLAGAALTSLRYRYAGVCVTKPCWSHVMHLVKFSGSSLF